ncbi:unnamed protein product [Rotaria socialis]|uniref:Uncharacterized protein n=2 Tax=Rotaria socialis TaxID=392032 RepID=A0A821B979_9BILA|nr:unnamed protein product [Rotaria socialis]CAF3414405.1 unnamed protein product [Rotaria socialis]CAF3492265.1 unnamed protein product [Rotaria socialis]CAF4104001.1 unnamed protein product [Rotaria socialis]CAF4453908.1 unnamed protein product [Rotaria socialis]
MMKADVSQPFSMVDGSHAFNIEQDQHEKQSYFKDLGQSFYLIHLKYKWFDEKHWKLAFCSSSFDCINKYPNIFLLYRTVLFSITIFDFVYGIVSTDPVHEWIIYYTHLTVLITFLAIVFQFLITYRANFYRGNDIVPRHSLQYVHIMLIIISLGSGLAVCLAYWSIIHSSTARAIPHSRIILEHGVLWFLLLIDVLFFTRLPIYMIDCIPIIIFGIIYGIFTIIIFMLQSRFSNNRIGYIYQALNLNSAPLRVSIQMFLFIFILPIAIIFILWNLFRLRRSIHVKITGEVEGSELNSIA